MRRGGDAVTLSNLPAGLDVYCGYDDGRYNNLAALKAQHPGARVWAVTVAAAHNYGDWLDIENGDATPEQAPGWTHMRRVAGHPNPGNYCSEASWQAVKNAYHAQGIAEPPYWIAGYPGSAGAGKLYPGAVGHQWIDHNNAWDESCWVDSIPGLDPTPPAPAPPPPPQNEGDFMGWTAYDPDSGGFWATDVNGDLNTENGAPFVQGLNQHPDYHAGKAESQGWVGGSNPCVGIETFKDKNGQHGIVYVTRMGLNEDQSALHFYRFARDGSPD